MVVRGVGNTMHSCYAQSRGPPYTGDHFNIVYNRIRAPQPGFEAIMATARFRVRVVLDE